jgi:predicted O-methyltransferase YrrM
MLEMYIIFFCGLFFLCLFLLFSLARKVTRIDKKIWNLDETLDVAFEKQYKQLEALGALQKLLNTKLPLPPTRGWAGSPDFLLTIARQAIENKPKYIVECSSGTSTIVLARSVEINGIGHVYSLENDPFFAEKTRNELRSHALDAYATVLIAPLSPVQIQGQGYSWYSLNDLNVPAIDMLVIDGPPTQTNKTARFPAVPLLYDRLSKGAAVFLDDALRPGEKEIVERWLIAYPSLISEKWDCEKGLVKLTK